MTNYPPHVHSDPDCGECKKLLIKIHETAVQTCTSVTLLRTSMIKIVYILLGMIGAKEALKYVGTPWYIYVFVFSTFTSAIFLTGTTIHFWKRINIWERLSYSLFSIIMLFACGLRIYFYKIGTPLPQEMGVIMNMLYSGLSWVLIIKMFKRV